MKTNWTRQPLALGERSYTRNAVGRRGQALLVAVLLMTVILLVGILFAALVSYNQSQSARHVDVVAAGQNCNSGISYASSMLESSPQGADWRPRFVAYSGIGAEDPLNRTTWPQDSSLWPSPPAMYRDGTVDFNFWGLDGTEGTEDDYYSDFDMVQGWFPLRDGGRSAPGPFLRAGYHRYPDPNQLGANRDALQLGRGYVLMQVTYDPDPPYEPDDVANQDRMSNCIRIVSIGRAMQDSNVFRRLVAYKPIGLTDHMLWITNQTGAVRQATVGIRANVDLNASQSLEAGESLYSWLPGPVRSEPPLYWVGQQVGATPAPSTTFVLETAPRANEGYLRDDAVLSPQGLYALDGVDAANGAQVSVGGTTSALPVSVAPTDASVPNRVYASTEAVPELSPVAFNPTDPVSGVSRYHALTRDSGQVARATANDADRGVAVGDPVNIGLYGHGPGMYVDNDDDIQYRGANGESNLAQLMNDWLRSPQGQGYVGSATGWNATFTTYTPPAVEIEFFPSEDAVLATSSNQAWSSTPPANAGDLWWPGHVAGTPGIKITRHDKRWRRGDHTAGAWHVGEDSGRNVMVIDYPQYPYQVVFAEGNVRVKGVLPARDRTNADLDRSFDVTVVSNATIYIDGQLMTAQDVHGRRNATNDGAALPNSVLDEDAAKVALLAKDYVCLNPTQLVPQLTSGVVTAAADDEANPTLTNQHWELYPNTPGAVYSQWRFGWPDADINNDGYGDGTPGVPVAPGLGVHFVPIHAGADPGPAGMGLTTYNEVAGNSAPYVFPGGNPFDQWTFMFVPPGALLGSVPTPAPYASNAIAPNWQIPGSTPAATFANPLAPFDVTANVTKNIGFANAITANQRDPQLGTGSTAYLIKKWKIEEYETDAATGYQIPRPSVHARINALMLAHRGSWFVIPGTYFDESATTSDYNGSGAIDGLDSLYAARFRRYNYEIVVRGAIVEDHAAPLEARQNWTNRWAFPIYTGSGAGLELAWGTIRYEFDERLRAGRNQDPASLTGTVRRSGNAPTDVQAFLPKLPCLPVSSTIMYGAGSR